MSEPSQSSLADRRRGKFLVGVAACCALVNIASIYVEGHAFEFGLSAATAAGSLGCALGLFSGLILVASIALFIRGLKELDQLVILLSLSAGVLALAGNYLLVLGALIGIGYHPTR